MCFVEKLERRSAPLSDRIDVQTEALEAADKLWVTMIQHGSLIGGQHIVVTVDDTNQLITAIRRASLTKESGIHGEGT